jgi:putative hemolysin
VGEIEDEYDPTRDTPGRASGSAFDLDGSLSLRELADDYSLELPRGEGYETLAGFVLDRLGAVPRGNETFVFENRRYTVLAMEGRRVARVRIEKLPEPSQTLRAAAAATAVTSRSQPS